MFEGRCKLAVCWPWSIDEVKSRFAETALNLKHPENCEVRWIRGRGWCASRRHNHCLEQAISWGADLILIVGADQVYPDTEMLCKLVNHCRGGCPVVTTLVPMRGMIASQKGGPFQAVAWRLKQDAVEAGITSNALSYDHFEVISREKHGDLVQIHAGGSGVLLFPSAALSKMAMPWFTEKPKYPTFEREQCCDLPFLIRLQAEAGLSIWCDTTIEVRHLHTFEIDHTFTRRFADWEQGGGDPSICAYGTGNTPEVPRETKILQARVSPSIPLYDKKFRKRYGLRPYHNMFQPAFFFGCYTDADVFAIHQHNGTAVIIWAGSDAERFRQLHKTGAYNGIFKPNVHHIAISKFIEDDLKAVGLPFKSLPLCCVDESMFKPTPREGRKGIYVYLPPHSREKYGGSYIDKLMPLLPEFDWIINDGTVPYEDMPALYDKCFVGVRPVKHDGLSNTRVEMGLMGRPTLNPYANDDQSIEACLFAVWKTYRREDDFQEVSDFWKSHINIGDDWKDTSFYEAGRMNTIPQDADQMPYEYQSYFDFRYSQGPRGAGGPSPNSIEAEWTRNKVIELLDEYECESVAEIGCGAMVRWDELPRERYVGIDVSPVAISHAKQKFPEASFVVEDSTQITPPAADAVICIDVLQHIKPEDVEKLVSSIFKQARKLAIIKTSVNIPNLYYQFNHDWNKLGGDAHYELTVPGAPVSRVFVFAASGGRGGICQAAVASPAPPSFSEACCDSDSRVSTR